MTDEQIRLYFRRIGLTLPAKPVPDGALLSRLHYHHCISIPYENIDFVTGKVFPAEVETQFRQVVLEGRGGVCLDLNLLFGELLQALGYGVELLGCDDLTAPPDGLHFHHALRVTDRDGLVWWCDVALFDSCFGLPCRFLDGEIQEQPGGKRLFLREADGKWLLRVFSSGAWEDTYRVLHSDVTPEYISERKLCDRVTYADNELMSVLYCNLLTPFGRRSLHGDIYRESIGEERVRLACDRDSLPWALRQFGLERCAEVLIK